MNYSLQKYSFIVNIAITEKGEKLPSLKTVSSLTVFSEVDKVKLNSSFFTSPILMVYCIPNFDRRKI
jgi:hypothetical protein